MSAPVRMGVATVTEFGGKHVAVQSGGCVECTSLPVHEPPAAFVRQRCEKAGDLLCLVARLQDEIYRVKSVMGDKNEKGNCSSSTYGQLMSKKKKKKRHKPKAACITSGCGKKWQVCAQSCKQKPSLPAPPTRCHCTTAVRAWMSKAHLRVVTACSVLTC